MPSINEVVTTVIEIKDAAVSQEGFGTPLIAAFHNFWPERVRTFSDPSELLLPPFNVPSTHSVYLLASALKRQKPAPTTFKVGKRLGAATQVVTITPSVPAIGEVFTLTVNGITYTATGDATPTASKIAAALATAMVGAVGIGAVGTTLLTLTATPPLMGSRHRFEALTPNLTLKETTVEPAVTLATDLAAIRAYDGDWYGLVIDSAAATEILATAVWAETQRVLFFPTTADGECLNPAVTTDVISAIKLAGYTRTIPMYHEKPQSQAAGASWAGRMLPKAPGSANWANMALAGVDKSNLSDGQRAALKAKNGNYYVDVKSIGFTFDGRAGSGRYADITHGNDWFEVRTQERIVGLLANNDKVPFTDKGGALIQAQVEAQILEAIKADVIDGEQTWSVTAPKIVSVNPNDKLARVFPNVKFSFVLQGAVNKVQIAGTVLIAP